MDTGAVVAAMRSPTGASVALLPAARAARVTLLATAPLCFYALRLPASIKVEAKKVAAQDGISLDQFIASAAAEKLAAMRTANCFAERKGTPTARLSTR